MFSDWFSLENVNPAELAGSILYVDASDADRMLIRHYLRETTLSVTTAESGAAGVEKAMEGFDLIIADYTLDGAGGGAAMLSEIRARGVQTPVILVTADTTAASPEEFARIQASAYLAKPIDARLLLRAIAEFLVVQQGEAGPTLSFCSTLKPDDPNAALLDEYVENLHAQSEKLKAEMKGASPKACWQICAGIKGAAASMGFAAIGELAEKAMRLLATGGGEGAEESQALLNRLADACARAHVKKAA
jgi:CheY-like chemotaxis protein/HPt (histidine-containing phosphotransfer) domain-containing protein